VLIFDADLREGEKSPVGQLVNQDHLKPWNLNPGVEVEI
jgi:hypothetical protein